MINRKGQVGVGLFMALFISVIVGLVLFQGSAVFVAQATDTQVSNNRTYTLGAIGTTIDLAGQELIDTPVVTNATNSAQIVPTSNYSITEGISTITGLKRIRLTSLGGNYSSTSVNISYTFGPEGYIDDAGGRSVADLVLIFSALLIAVVALTPSLREKFFD